MTQAQTTVAKKVSPRKPAAPKVEPKAEIKAPRRAVTAKAKTAPVEKATAAPKSVLRHVAGAAVKFFVFIEGARPVSGVRLTAHTDAALRFLGLADNNSVRKAAAIAVMGNRAVKYHLERGNLEEAADKVKLTAQGTNFFRGRVDTGKVDTDLSKAFLSAIQKGKANADAGIKDSHLIPVGLVIC